MKNISSVFVFGRPPLVFMAFGCALWLMYSKHPVAYILGLSFLMLSMAFDWLDGWLSRKEVPRSRLGPLVDRMMDRLVLTIMFPVLGAGMLWRFARLDVILEGRMERAHLLHALFVLGLCVIVLMRDQLVNFLKSFEPDPHEDVESHGLTRIRSLVFSPMAVLLYAHAFYQPTSGWEAFYRMVDWVDRMPLRVLFVLEILFLAFNIGSITLNIRKYGTRALDDICADDELMRRKILAILPNTITLMNGLLGVAAVLFASHGRFREAVFILLSAALLDRMDGLIARRLGLTEPLKKEASKKSLRFGVILDDISDAISFAFAPAAIFYLLMDAVEQDFLSDGMVITLSVLYALAGVARLTYFTLDKKPIPGFFKGMPVPAAALLVAGPMEILSLLSRRDSWLFDYWVVFTVSIVVLSAIAMNLYPVRYLHIGRLLGRKPAVLRFLFVLALVMVFTPYFGLVLMSILLFYLISPVFTWRIDPAVANRETPTAEKGT
ncbi:MAG: CDP-alcohol phosphatidyltransferase family protein [Deltaproteobacteria bacterium]|nr:CDP-alcohol phosphatidyltransferase family protein [Deltaproteobacteria bacterium]